MSCLKLRQLTAGIGLSAALLLSASCTPKDSAKTDSPVPAGAEAKTGEGEPKKPVDTSARDQAYADVQRLSQYPTHVLPIEDDGVRSAYQSLFGGLEYQDLHRFVADRVHWFMTPEDVDQIRIGPGKFVIPPGLLDPKAKNPSSPNEKEKKPSVMTVAKNIGTALYLAALAGEVPVRLSIGGTEYPLDSSRVGIVMMGPGYLRKIKARDEYNREVLVDLPYEVRLATLVHEARHSDCNAEITSEDLKTLMGTPENFEHNYRPRSCGHLHSRCAKDHPLPEYRDQIACDDQPWGSYMTGSLFLRVARESYSQGSLDRAIVDAYLADSAARLRQPFVEQVAGKWGAPDPRQIDIRPGEVKRGR